MVDERARDLHVAHRQAAPPGELADLGDDDAAAVPGGHRHREHLALDRLALHRQVAVLVRCRPTDDGHVDRERVIEQPFPPTQADDLDEVLGRPRVLLAPGQPWIDIRAKADQRDQPGPPGGDLAHELREDALRERVRLDLVRLDPPPEPRLVADVAADRPPHEPGQAELREAAIGEVADADDADRGQVAGMAMLGVDRRQLVDEPLGQRMAGARAADHHGAAVADEPDRLSDVEDGGHGM